MNYSHINPNRKRVAISFINDDGEPVFSPTEQSHKDMCDVDKIIRQYDRTGLVTHLNTARALYGDFTQINEYQESMNIVIAAETAFQALPSQVRREFENDAGKFMEFATNPKNKDKMIELGLIEKPVETSSNKKSDKGDPVPEPKEP